MDYIDIDVIIIEVHSTVHFTFTESDAKCLGVKCILWLG